MKKLVVDQLEIQLERKKIKNMYLRVKPPMGTIHVNAPMKMSEEYIVAFIRAKMEWIKFHQEKVQSKTNHRELQYVTGEKIWVLGKEYTLQVLEDAKIKKASITVVADTLQLIIDNKRGVEEKKRILQDWYKDILQQALDPIIKSWEGNIEVEVMSWYIRDMKSCWGTCNVVKKRMCFNLQLATKSPDLIEYVVVHELVHLLERSHNQRFKNFMSHYLPDWKERKIRLNSGNGTDLASMEE